MRGSQHGQERADAGLGVRTRSRLQDLLPELLQKLDGQTSADPFRGPTIVVPGPAVREWLEHAIADRDGVAASLDLPTLPELVTRIEDAVHGPLPESIRRARGPSALPLRILTLLERIAADPPPEARDLARFLERSVAAPERRYGLARVLADRFQAYRTARHDVLASWEQQLGQGFQGLLWHELVRAERDHQGEERTTEVFGAARVLGLDEHVRAGRADAALEDTLHLFGFSSLQPLHADLIGAAAERTRIELYLSAPSVEYHDIGETGATLELLQRLARPAEDLVRIAIDHLDLDHEDLLGAFEALVDLPPTEDDAPLLRCLQAHVRERRSRDRDPLPPIDPREDRSLQVIRCASPRRELEVCREQVWRAFDELDDLRPDDIAILVPDVSQYAGLARAIFEHPETDGSRSLPMHVADRRARERVPTAATFLALLEFADGPFDRASFLDLLRREPMHEALGCTPDEIEALGDRLEDAGVSWGYDTSDRSRLEAPAGFVEGTFREGLERLALGHAVGPIGGVARRSASGIDRRRPVPLDLEPQTLVPTDHGGSGRADEIDRLADVASAVATTCASLRIPRPLAEWPAILLRAIEAHLVAPNRGRELAAIREAIAGLSEVGAVVTGPDAEALIPLGTMRTALEDLLDEVARPPFVTGSITLSALRPLRHLPFRMICVLGLVDGEFPRESEDLPFDLIAHERRPGDRVSRDEDRMAFLEALLAANDRVLLTYPGWSASGSTERAPSTCLTQLQDWCRKSFADPVTAHNLIADAPKRADDPKAFEADADERVVVTDPRAAAVATARQQDSQPFELCTDTTEVPPLPERLVVSIEDLERFWRAPTEWTLSRVLDLRLERDTEAPTELERQTWDNLSDWALRDALAAVGDEGEAKDWRAAGASLPSPLADAHVRRIWREAEDLLSRLGATEFLPPRPIDFGFEHDGLQVRILGELDGLTPNGLTSWRASNHSWRHVMPAAVRHALASVLAGGDLDDADPLGSFSGTTAHFRDQSIHLARLMPAPARDLLAELIRGYWVGQHGLLPFDPIVVDQISNRALSRDSLLEDLIGGSLEGKWDEIRDKSIAVKLAYRESRPWQYGGFEHWMRSVFLPLIAARGGSA